MGGKKGSKKGKRGSGKKTKPQQKKEEPKAEEPKVEEPVVEEPVVEVPAQETSEDYPESGVNVVTTEKGDGVTFPKAGDTLKMHYTGTLRADGSQFDSSRDRGTLFSFTIGQGQVIKGWDEGVIKMSLGERANLLISSDFGYGAGGSGASIPGGADLKFDVELVGINGDLAWYTQEQFDAFKSKMEAWSAKLLKKYDGGAKPEWNEKKNAEHGDRDGFEKFLTSEVEADLAKITVK